MTAPAPLASECQTRVAAHLEALAKLVHPAGSDPLCRIDVAQALHSLADDHHLPGLRRLLVAAGWPHGGDHVNSLGGTGFSRLAWRKLHGWAERQSNAGRGHELELPPVYELLVVQQVEHAAKVAWIHAHRGAADAVAHLAGLDPEPADLSLEDPAGHSDFVEEPVPGLRLSWCPGLPYYALTRIHRWDS